MVDEPDHGYGRLEERLAAIQARFAALESVAQEAVPALSTSDLVHHDLERRIAALEARWDRQGAFRRSVYLAAIGAVLGFLGTLVLALVH